ncbi:MAG TPA: DUF4402 domain-containing protein [Sphingomicrobium sp.]|nr:DUF4402 domain-containing protein [Sphingomicrobium sp.]
MPGRSIALVRLALIGALAISAPAMPQEVAAPCRLCTPGGGQAEVKPATPVSLDVHTSLDFGRLILASQGIGTAELGPDGAQAVSGSIASMSARAMVGEVVVRGEPGRAVRVILPGSIELFGLGGGSIQLGAIRSDLPSLPRLDGNGSLRFRFGGAVRIIGDVDGEFRGNVPVEVDYL